MDAKLIIIGIIAALLVLPAAAAQVSLERSLPDEVFEGSPLVVRINISNSGTVSEDIAVEERVFMPAEYVEPKAPKVKMWGGLSVEYLEWNLSVGPGSSETLSYILRPTSPGLFGFPPTIVRGKGISYGESGQVLVRCVPDGKCDPGENVMNCEDCTTGIADGNCDYKEDDRCDPDCEEGYDPDCETASKPASDTGITPTTPPKAGENNTVYLIALIVIIVILLLALALVKVRRKKPAGKLKTVDRE